MPILIFSITPGQTRNSVHNILQIECDLIVLHYNWDIGLNDTMQLVWSYLVDKSVNIKETILRSTVNFEWTSTWIWYRKLVRRNHMIYKLLCLFYKYKFWMCRFKKNDNLQITKLILTTSCTYWLLTQI